jgi:hypothetical protein
LSTSVKELGAEEGIIVELVHSSIRFCQQAVVVARNYSLIGSFVVFEVLELHQLLLCQRF